jgi:hypothetical protein
MTNIEDIIFTEKQAAVDYLKAAGLESTHSVVDSHLFYGATKISQVNRHTPVKRTQHSVGEVIDGSMVSKRDSYVVMRVLVNHTGSYIARHARQVKRFGFLPLHKAEDICRSYNRKSGVLYFPLKSTGLTK